MAENGDGSRKLNFGDLLHFLEVAVILISIGINFERFEAMAKTSEGHTQALDRIEHYLSSQDPKYWHKTHENGDGH
jgi:hypothetical protein